jgi:hypothetical protein
MICMCYFVARADAAPRGSKSRAEVLVACRVDQEMCCKVAKTASHATSIFVASYLTGTSATAGAHDHFCDVTTGGPYASSSFACIFAIV